MLRKIFLRMMDGTELDRLTWVFPFVFLFLAECFLSFMAGTYLTFFIGDLIHVDVRPLMDHLMFPITFVLPFIDLFWDVIKWGGSRIKLSKKRKKRKRINFLSTARSFFSDIRSDSEKWFISTFGITPHLDKYIGLKERIKVISGMKFRPYKHRLEGKVRFLKVSEDDKWVKILGKYFPLDLICGYNNETNQLFFIDGYVVKLWTATSTDALKIFLMKEAIPTTICPPVPGRDSISWLETELTDLNVLTGQGFDTSGK